MAEQSSLSEGKKRERKPKARATEIVLGALDERMQMVSDPIHSARLLELADELRRSLSKDTSAGNDE